MNPLPHWLASPEWTQLVKALLHTLWQAAALAVILGFALRRRTNPQVRYRCSFAALVLVLFAGIVTWSALNGTTASPPVLTAAEPQISVETPMEAPRLGIPDAVVTISRSPAKPKLPPWTAWLGVVWIAGATLMVLRAGFQVAGAEKLRRGCRPLGDERVHRLAAEARRTIGLARQVRIVATEKLTSPAVVGVLVPTLILPLSLVTTLTPEQIRFILLHELAHIRRGDYLANLFQLFVEALLFFNPAVWWISHQVRREREACCDALAIELSGAPADYARTLLHVAETTLAVPAAANAFGEKQNSSSLADRIQRLLIPGYRPALRLTWRAMLGTLVLGAALLVLSAVGTRVTVAQIISAPKQPTKPSDLAANNIGNTNLVPFEITSGKGSFDVRTGIGTYSNNVVVKGTNFVIHADSVSVNEKTGEMNASGHVVLERDGKTFEMESFRLLPHTAIQQTNTSSATVIAPTNSGISLAQPVATTNETKREIVVEFVGFNDPGMMAGLDRKRILPFPAPSIRFHSANFNDSVSAVLIEAASAEERDLPLEKIPGVREFKFDLQRILGNSKMPRDMEVYRQAIQRSFEENGVQLSSPKGVSVEASSVVVHAAFSDWVTVAQKRAKAGTKFTTKPVSEPRVISTSESRRAILMKLQDIRLENFAVDAQPLSNVIRQLSQQVRMSDPQSNGINFMISPNTDAATVPNSPRIDPATGLPVAPSSNSVPAFDSGAVLVTVRPALTNARLADVVEAVVNGASKPMKYSLLEYGITFSPKAPGPESMQLHQRRFKVNSDQLKTRIGVTSSTPAEFQTAIFRYVSSNGVDLSPASGKNVFFNNNDGSLLVRATAIELDIVEAALAGLEELPQPMAAQTKEQATTFAQNGKFYYEAGKLDEAQAELEKALALDPNHPAARVYLRIVESQKAKGGSRDFDPIIRDNISVPESLDASQLQIRRFKVNVSQFWKQLGLGASEVAGQPRFSSTPGEFGLAAMRFFSTNAGVDLSPTSGKTILFSDTRGDLMIRATTNELDRIEKALLGMGLPTGAQRESDTLVQNGKFYYEAGKLDEAQAELEKALALDPNHPAARFYLGLVKEAKLKGFVREAAGHNTKGMVHPLVTFTNLEEREFRMDTNRLVLNLGNFGVLDQGKLRQARSANDPNEMEQIVGSAMFKWFGQNGVDMQWQQVPTLRWDHAAGILEVRATSEEMKKIEALSGLLNKQLPQINIKTKFVAVPDKDIQELLRTIGITNSGAASGTKVLNPGQFKSVLTMLQKRRGVDLMNEMQVTTYGGCQAQIQFVDVKTYPTNINPRALTSPGILSSHGTNVLLQVATVPLGPVFDVLPTVGADGWTIGLNMIASLVEFHGYEKGETVTAYVDGAETKVPMAKPRFNVQQLSRQAIVWDGQTVVLFDQSKKADSPKTGEQPKQLLVFATATLINEKGERIHSDAEMEFDNRRLPPQPSQPPERIF